MNNDVVTSIQSLSAVGEELHKQYVKNVVSGETSISETLSKVGFFLFSSQHHKGQTKQQTETALLKQNLQIANKLWMTASIRGITPEEFFPYENNIDPPSISFACQMRRGIKSDLLTCLESVTPKSKCADIPNTVTAGIVDAPCLVHMIPPDPGSTFEDYRHKIMNHGKQKLVKVCEVGKYTILWIYGCFIGFYSIKVIITYDL